MGTAGILASGESGPREELPGIDVDMGIFFLGPRASVPGADNRSPVSAARFVRRTPTVPYKVRIGDSYRSYSTRKTVRLPPAFALTGDGPGASANDRGNLVPC